MTASVPSKEEPRAVIETRCEIEHAHKPHLVRCPGMTDQPELFAKEAAR